MLTDSVEAIEQRAKSALGRHAKYPIAYKGLEPTQCICETCDLARWTLDGLDARKALAAVVNVGHNDDCMFCGFKDRAALGRATETN